MAYFSLAYVAKPSAVNCPQCGRTVARIYKRDRQLGVPLHKCRRCGAEFIIENYLPFQLMTKKQKTGAVLSLLFRCIILSAAFGGLIGAVLLFLIIVIYPYDLADFPLVTLYLITTLIPFLLLACLQLFKFLKILRGGKKWLTAHPAE